MIKNWIFTGDTHGRVDERLWNISRTVDNPEETAVIILGDASLNFYLNNKDTKRKESASKYGFTIYCVRGNHEARPSAVDNMVMFHDDNVNGMVYIEHDYPFIRYFMESSIYEINNKKVLVIGGAYSVDKFYRIANNWTWFENEQLTEHEMSSIEKIIDFYYENKVDMILSHTCPYSWRPTDLFLDCVDQTTVDNTMELWMDKMERKWEYDYWLFGHYHANRAVRPGALMFYQGWLTLDQIPAAARGEIERFELDPKYHYKTLD